MLTRILLTVLAVTAGFNAVSATTWECLYYQSGAGYTCVINVGVAGEMDTIRIIGQHTPGFGNDNVTRLEIMDGDMQSIPHELFNTFKNLNYFRIWRGSLRFVSRLSNCQKLVDFDVSGLGVTRLETTAFVDCSSILNINMAFNNVSYLPAGLFPMDANLGLLHFEQNAIGIIEPDFFAAVNNIRMFRLYGNFCINTVLEDIGRGNLDQHMSSLQRCFDAAGFVEPHQKKSIT